MLSRLLLPAIQQSSEYQQLILISGYVHWGIHKEGDLHKYSSSADIIIDVVMNLFVGFGVVDMMKHPAECLIRKVSLYGVEIELTANQSLLLKPSNFTAKKIGKSVLELRQ